ncbi:MAG: hypothetical protein RL244_1522 [Pseudomonadota bacterium]|jgi:hypothetical protein
MIYKKENRLSTAQAVKHIFAQNYSNKSSPLIYLGTFPQHLKRKGVGHEF